MSGAAAAFVAGGASIAIVLSPTAVSGFYDVGGTHDVTTGSVLATASGGVGALTYAWARVDSSAYTWTIGSAAAATTSFTGLSIPEGVHTTATFELTVTDSAGNIAKKQIVATVRNKISDFGGGGTF